jgi:addiction module HigA family antidote
MARLPNIHPGEILLEEFLKPMGITAYRLAKEIGVSQTRVSQIINMNRGISAETALRLGRFFGMSAEFWLGLQYNYELKKNKRSLQKELDKIKTCASIKEHPESQSHIHQSPVS